MHKATIIPRGRALGLVMSLPEGDRYSKHKSKLKAELATAIGGSVAEELIFGPDNASNGVAGDMSDKLGMITYGDNSQEVFLGHSVAQTKNVSEETAGRSTARSAASWGAYERAKTLLSDNIDELHPLAKGLLEQETLTGEGIKQVIRGEPIVRNRPDEPVNQNGGSSEFWTGRLGAAGQAASFPLCAHARRVAPRHRRTRRPV